MNRFRRERRLAGRHSFKTALRTRIWKSQIPDATGESLNLSPRGMYLSTEAILRQGEAVEVFFDMPEEITGEPNCEWRCTGHVVRTDSIEGTEATLGVGVQFDCYEIARARTAEALKDKRKPARMISVLG